MDNNGDSFRFCGDLQISRVNTLPRNAAPRGGRNVFWLETECGDSFHWLRGANQLFELRDGSVVVVVDHEAAVIPPNGLSILPLTAGIWCVARRSA